jgi:hypothetical protein
VKSQHLPSRRSRSHLSDGYFYLYRKPGSPQDSFGMVSHEHRQLTRPFYAAASHVPAPGPRPFPGVRGGGVNEGVKSWPAIGPAVSVSAQGLCLSLSLSLSRLRSVLAGTRGGGGPPHRPSRPNAKIVEQTHVLLHRRSCNFPRRGAARPWVASAGTGRTESDRTRRTDTQGWSGNGSTGRPRGGRFWAGPRVPFQPTTAAGLARAVAAHTATRFFFQEPLARFLLSSRGNAPPPPSSRILSAVQGSLPAAMTCRPGTAFPPSSFAARLFTFRRPSWRFFTRKHVRTTSAYGVKYLCAGPRLPVVVKAVTSLRLQGSSHAMHHACAVRVQRGSFLFQTKKQRGS